MEIEIVRKYFKKDYIIGDCFVNGVWFSNSLEPSVSRKHFPGVPEGKYSAIVMMSAKFKANRIYLKRVPNRVGIMIHEGNSIKDTLGCILLGCNSVPGMVLNSKKSINALMRMVSEEGGIHSKINVTITH